MNKKPQEIELSEVLLKDNTSQCSKPSKTSFDERWLSQLFEIDYIKDRVSNKLIDSIGGYKGLEEKLTTNRQRGITASGEDISERRSKFGRNDPVIKLPRTLWDMVLQNFQDPILRILCLAAVVSLTLGIATKGLVDGWIESCSILLAVFIVTVVASGNNYMKQKQFRKLNEVASRKNVNAIRNGTTCNMSVYQLLVGDVVYIETGEVLSVDGIVLEANRLHVDQSAMTEETTVIKKEVFQKNMNSNCFLVSGTKVIEGTGKMLVLTVGSNTIQNKLKLKLQQQSDQTPLQMKLQVLADQIGKMGIWASVITLVFLVGHLLIDSMGDGSLFSLQFLNKLVDYVIIAVTLVVMAVPEGLPLAVTISLAYSVGKMKDENNLVRFLASCETMGGANNICSDKTGTLTKNQMTVTKLWALQQIYEKFEKEDKSTAKLEKEDKTPAIAANIKELLGFGISLNSNAHPIKKENKFQQIGNKTECALLEMVYKFGYNFQEIRKQVKALNTVPFSSDRKRMSVIYYLNQKKRYYIFSKGAPEILIQSCKYFVNKANTIVPIDDEWKEESQRIISQFSSQSLRTLMLCYRQISKQELQTDHPQKLENNLIVVGITGIKDPLKESVPQAVINCKKAGIIVRMVTGDNTETAIAIAKETNIIPLDFVRPKGKEEKGYYVVMEGKEFRELVGGLIQVPVGKGGDEYKQQEGKDVYSKKNTEEEDRPKMKDIVKNISKLQQIASQLRVLARSSPQDKHLLAAGLKQLNNVVAMTGDGTNDASALKKADIGFAMGIAGTQIAKQAAGIILLDDNFSSIITAVKYGRNIFDCIRKFLQFRFIVNAVAICIAFMGASILKESPLTPVQMLWLNLIMDTLGALALATEPPSEELLKRMPYSRNEHIITPQMWRGIVFNSLYQIILLSIVLFKGDVIFGVPHYASTQIDIGSPQNQLHLSIFFNIFVFLQVFNFLNARKLRKQQINVFANFFNNYLFIFIVGGVFFCQLLIMQYAGQSFHVTPLSVGQHVVCILIGATSLLWNVMVKLFIPDWFMNNFELLRENQVDEITHPDSIFERWEKHPATERRRSKKGHLGREK